MTDIRHPKVNFGGNPLIHWIFQKKSNNFRRWNQQRRYCKAFGTVGWWGRWRWIHSICTFCWQIMWKSSGLKNYQYSSKIIKILPFQIILYIKQHLLPKFLLPTTYMFSTIKQLKFNVLYKNQLSFLNNFKGRNF